ncbi:DUF2231 domain-containing protein [Cyanobacteria bacterium FACHB-DQ100]|uniref:DUF2231 domain-containing protein n=1 Tax=unclassified Leptolyngbya TaxID=2650499 RepID=UPI001680EF60|nr:DUF2231 domain-containing protein [Leptolyngbya sp. FACHB-17]MBD1821871.1 DUF2231 domain-containing protein [Cyanobacteria bacterium FACHB-DQ100]MBD2081545.1 DUF2231 domain-containing protein [Leptolyngbya sp. FACHB-17]
MSRTTPNIPLLIESDEAELRDSGVPSTVHVAKHPLHPLIVTFPIALLTSTLLTDGAYWLTSDAFWARASFWLLIGGLISGLVAAATGMSDFLRIQRVREHSAGWAHMVGNIAALALSAANLWLRWGNQTGAILPTGIIISVLVAATLGITGWYGAELIYRHKVAVIGVGPKGRP